MQKATQKQLETIKELASKRFGDIYSSGFEAFSAWLMEHVGYFDLHALDKEAASKVIKLLKISHTKPKNIHTPRGEFLRKVALALVKAYLRGFYEGQVSKETPPSMESLVDEMLRAFHDKKADSI